MPANAKRPPEEPSSSQRAVLAIRVDPVVDYGSMLIESGAPPSREIGPRTRR